MDSHAGGLAVLKKLGFQVEGTLRGKYLIDGAYADAIRRGLFRDECHKCAAPVPSDVARQEGARATR